jgi:hypothetical protein
MKYDSAPAEQCVRALPMSPYTPWRCPRSRCVRCGVQLRILRRGSAAVVCTVGSSHAQPDTMQVSQATFELIKDDFRCAPRGPIEVKAKGVLETWYLESRRNGGVSQIS